MAVRREQHAESVSATSASASATAYAKLADHRVEPVWIPFKGQALPAWLHLPPGYKSGRLPAVVTIPGMDSFKEISVSMYGDRWLNRGIAVLAVDGPGQYESAVLGIPVTVENWIAAGGAIMDWLAKRPEIDIARVGVVRQQLRLILLHHRWWRMSRASRPCAVTAPYLEPGCHTIFEEASPTFKQRFMYMAQIQRRGAASTNFARR